MDEDAASAVVGAAEFVAEGHRAQAASVTVLTGRDRLPLGGTQRVYVEGIAPDAAARLGTVVADPADATLAVVRLQAPWEHRDDLFLESWFHQGSLAFPPGLRWRLARIAEACPLIVDVFLDRPAVLSDLVDVADVLVADFGTNDHALVDALTGVVEPVGVLPFDLPRSMDDVRAHPEDRPGFDDPLFAAGWRC